LYRKLRREVRKGVRENPAPEGQQKRKREAKGKVHLKRVGMGTGYKKGKRNKASGREANNKEVN
jgi:hypothetical protein